MKRLLPQTTLVRALIGLAAAIALDVPLCFAQAPQKPSRTEIASDDVISKAVSRGLELVQKAAANYPKHRDCFSCHHQTLPMLAMVSARGRATKIDEDLFKEQAEFTHRTFEPRIEDLKEGRGIGGRALTVGYGLWTLRLADRKRDDTTEAMVTFLLKTQTEDGRWSPQTVRPPLEESHITCTVLAADGIRRFATESQRTEVDAAVARAKKWLATAAVTSQEDRVARLWGVKLLGGSEDELRTARDSVLKAQRDDGGWGQLDDMPSDAYAAGQTLFILLASGLESSHRAVERGVEFLIRTQRDDGSWLVETRSKPVQLFFDNGDPHGKHQFISTSATSWAVAALASAMKPRDAKPE